MPKNFGNGCSSDLTFYGKSELLAQLAQELECNPDSCLTRNVNAWYNSLYSELSDFSDCRYQVEINQELCEKVDTPDKLLELLRAFVLGNVEEVILEWLIDEIVKEGRRAGKRTIDSIERRLRRGLKQATSREVN